ncbi:hypothetical protein IEQ34_016588 [Dendrobium chrysotoxum]|uniref:Pentatricopeptide repeat-containing protein n=1 Tax=Dendrobium chrysotoxum TaxID=161865 RepID=A0AAV7FYH3_DENCH|nr:hypothetical protein IEQ34_016588 [Dendrobium chrysotoxum]
MIIAYTPAGFTDEAKALFHLMLDIGNGRNHHPNHTTIAAIASSFAQFGSPSRASFLQAYNDRHGIELLNGHNIVALIDLHSKCENIDKAYNLFCRWKQKDLIQEANSKPDAICFVSLLAACIHSSMVKEGNKYSELMRSKYCITPTTEHYMGLVDLLGWVGMIEEAYRLINEGMLIGVRLNARVWDALLSRSHCNAETKEIVERCSRDVEPLIKFMTAEADGDKWKHPLSAFQIFDPKGLIIMSISR